MKKFASIILTAIMLAAMLSVFAVTASADDIYAGLSGSGTASEPYEIDGIAQWDLFASAVKNDPSYGEGKYFLFTHDIGSREEGISTSVDDFSGVLDGGGKTVWFENWRPMVVCNNGEIRNMIIRSNEETSLNTGGTVCATNYGVIDRCVNYVSIISGVTCGSICGENLGLIVNCINYAPISKPPIEMDENDIGGICGVNCGHVLNCINTASVAGSGISGILSDNGKARIEICFNCGKPSSGYGITEMAENSSNLLLHSCSFLSPVDGTECKASNNHNNNASAAASHGGKADSISAGVSAVNEAIKAYDNQTGHKLVQWKVGADSLPALAEPLQSDFEQSGGLGSVFSIGNLWIVIAGFVVILGGVAALVIVKKKKKPVPANSAGETSEE